MPGAWHTGGIEAQPREYERRVVGFFDDTLLGDWPPVAADGVAVLRTPDTGISRCRLPAPEEC